MFKGKLTFSLNLYLIQNLSDYYNPNVFHPRKKISTSDFSLIFTFYYISPTINSYRLHLFNSFLFYIRSLLPLLLPQFSPHNLFSGLRISFSFMVPTVHALYCCQTDFLNGTYNTLLSVSLGRKILTLFIRVFASLQRDLHIASGKGFISQVNQFTGN